MVSSDCSLCGLQKFIHTDLEGIASFCNTASCKESHTKNRLAIICMPQSTCALALLGGQLQGHPARKKLSVGLLVVTI